MRDGDVLVIREGRPAGCPKTRSPVIIVWQVKGRRGASGAALADSKSDTIREYGSLTSDGNIRVELRVKQNTVDFVFVYKSSVASEAEGESRMEFSTPVTIQSLKILRDMLDDAEVFLRNEFEQHDTV